MRTTGRASGTDGALDAIYAAALDPAGWSKALGQVADTIGATAGFFFSTHSDTDPGAVLHVHNQPASLIEEFAAYWHTQDPWALAARRKGFMARGSLVVDRQLMPLEEFRNTAYYNDWCRQYDVEGMLGSVLFDGTEREPMPFTNLCWYRPPGAAAFGAAEKSRVEGFMAHFQRSLKIQRQVGWLGNERAYQAFSGMQLASLVMDRRGTVHDHNEAGKELLERLPVGCFRYGQLRSLGSRCAPPLPQALAVAARGEPARVTAMLPGSPPQVVGATVMKIPHELTLGPVRNPQGRERFLLLVELPRTGGAHIAKAVAELFALSPAEVRVLAGLLDGKAPKAIAQDAGTSLPTVRTQISNLLAKTGARAQTDLMLMLRGLRC